MIEPRVVAELSGAALRNNYEVIQRLVPGLSILPMIKADGYGHGATWAARELLAMPGLYGFGVATLEEGASLRRELGIPGRRVSIIVFSGALPWSEEKGRFCEKFQLTPVIASESDWHLFLREKWPERLPYELKFNTGMNRLGMPPAFARQIAHALKTKPALWHPRGVLSHLAMAETPGSRVSRLQKEQFAFLRAELAGALPSAHFHLGNSSAIWNEKYWDLKKTTDVVRPGISLYGVPPWRGAPARGLEAVLELKANVLAVHHLKPGQSIGYGATFTAKKETTHAAILAAGYADGIKRAFSQQGHAWIDGQATRFLGIVSMDLSAVRCTPKARVGDWVELLGPHVDPWEQARAAGTIPYELLTSLSGRVQRRVR